MSITIKLSNGTRKTVDVQDFSVSVKELKALIAPVAEIPEDEQRIVLRGKVLKDGDILSAVGMESGNAVHVVGCKKKAEQPPAPVAQTSPVANVASPGAGNSTNTTVQEPAIQSNPYAALLGSGAGGAGAVTGAGMGAGFGAGAGGAFPPFGGMGGNSMDPQMAMQLMQNPAMMQFMQQAVRDPMFMQLVAQSNPLLANMPPETLQQLMQLSAQSMGAQGGFTGQGGAQAGSTASAPGAGGAGGMNFNPAMFAPPQPQGDPHVIYRVQLDQLREMGFPNEAANIAALQQSQGNVDFAIERLFNA